MTFLAILLAFLIVQYWGFGDAAQKDAWYRTWLTRTRAWVTEQPGELQLLLQVLPPVVVLFVVMSLLSFSILLQLLIAVPVLLFSFGRGDFSEWVRGYAEAYHRGDNVAAVQYAERLGVLDLEHNDWAELHARVLRQAGYRGFERMFVAIFWFACLGPMGALFYRLTALSLRHQGQSDAVQASASRLLWLLEWPAVRLLGLSFALTGNFVGCFQRWKDCLLCIKRPTAEVMEHYIHGALNVNDNELVLEQVTEQEVEALLPLLSRTLVLWLCVLALLAIVS